MASTSPSNIAFILQVKVTVAPNDVDTFLSHFKPCYDKVLAEPECAYFLVGQDFQRPGVFRWTEGWTKGPEWFMTVQIKKEYYEPYLKATEPLFISERIIEAYAPLDGLNNVKADFFQAPA